MALTKTMIAALVAAVALAGCGGGLASSDPEGYAACQALIESREASSDDALGKFGPMLEAGERAAKAKTESIRNASSPVFDQQALDLLPEKNRREVEGAAVPDVEKLEAACEGAGVDIPDAK